MTRPALLRAPVPHNPGGKVRLPLLPGVRGAADFSDCRRFRHWLSRTWGDDVEPYALWIGLNPSTAEADVDDPTIRREIEFTRRLGLPHMVKVNVMDYRATKPSALFRLDESPCSAENRETIKALATRAAKVICAWGAAAPRLRPYVSAIEHALILRGVELWCLGTTIDGHPRHPLYVKGDTPLQRYRP